MKFKIGLAALMAFAAAAPVAAQGSASKIDKALTQSVKDGCGVEQVIIRTQSGYRGGVSLSLLAHGDTVAADHPGIEAVSAELHCEDLAALASFPEVLSISLDAMVSADGLGGPAAARASKGAAKASQRSTIARPAKDAQRRRQEGDHRAAPQTELSRPTGTAKAELTRASTAQDAFFDTLGVRGRRWPSRTLNAVMLGDVVGADHIAEGADDERNGDGATAVGVAVVDSGIAPGVDFDHRITHFYDFTGGRARKVRPSDPYGHGTHVAGLIGSAFVGVAPEVRLVGLRVLDGFGKGRTSHVIKAIEFATANRHQLGISAINLSLGHPVYEPAATDPLVQAVEHAVRAGLVVITTSGNVGINPATGLPGYAGVLSPGNAPSALTAGAIDTAGTRTRGDDRVAPYSSRGPSWYDANAKPDIVAPGHNMLSVAAAGSRLRREHEKRGGSGSYMRLSGTSMAAGVTSGVVALMLQTNPHLTPNALKMLLEFTAIPVADAEGRLFDPLAQGAGAINASGAIRLGLAIDATQPVGHQWLTAGMPFTSTLGGEVVNWSQTIIWGQRRLRGDGIVTENREAWSNNVVWGTGAGGEDDNIVWGTAADEGDNIVWGTNFIWSDAYDDNLVWGTAFEDDNIVWGTNLVWGNRLIGISEDDNIVWGTASEDDNIVWGTLTDDNIVWGTFYDEGDNILRGTFLFGRDDNIVWGTLRFSEADNIVWGTLRFSEADNIVWGTMKFGEADNIVWGTLRFSESDNIVWGTSRGNGGSDNIVWGTGTTFGDILVEPLKLGRGKR